MNTETKKKPKIAFYMTTILEHSGGMERYLVNAAHYFSQNLDVDADVITMDESTTRRITSLLSFYNFRRSNRFPIHNESTRSINEKLMPARYIQCHTFAELRSKLNEYDVVYSKNELLEAFIFKFIIGYRQIPRVVFGCHTPIFYPYTKSLQSKLHNILYNGTLYRLLGNGVSKFHVLNSDDLQRVSKLYPAAAVVQIPNPVDIVKFFKSSFVKNAQFNVLYVGRMTEQKGIDILADSIRLMAEVDDVSAINFLFVGSGDQSNLLSGLCEELKNCRFLGHQNDVASIYMRADLVIVPSRWESFCYTAAEAQACGIPVIASDISGPKDLILNGKTGWLITPNDPQLLSAAILRARNMWELDYSNYTKMGVSARQHIIYLLEEQVVYNKIKQFLLT